MTTKALFVKLEAKPGKENEVAKFLRDGQGLVQQSLGSAYDLAQPPSPSSTHLRMMPRAPVWKSCRGANGERARATGRAAED
jgi:hypothetical protein